jgi:hypothetical protein
MQFAQCYLNGRNDDRRIKMKFSELEIGSQFECSIRNGLSKIIGMETMRKVDATRALVLATKWDIPETDARRRLHDDTGETVNMLVPGFDPDME